VTDPAEPAPVAVRLRELARTRLVRIAIADSTDPRVRDARERIIAERIGEPVCVESPRSHPDFEDIAYRYYQALRDDGVTEEGAVALAEKPAWFAAGLVATGSADACLSGPRTAPQQLLLAASRALAPHRKPRSLCASTLLMRGDTTVTLADAHIVEAPGAEQLAAIAKHACDLHRRLTGDPTSLAFLAAAETGTAEQARESFHRRWPGLDAVVAAADALMHDCDREPNVLIVPGRAAGAAALGLLARLGGYRVLGPILHGVPAACVSLPPCATTEDVVDAAAIAAVLTG